MADQLPGLNVHMNAGRIAGTFDLPPADMEQITYHGRVMFVLVADVDTIKVNDTKDGDTLATWTFKVFDSAIVRDDGMKEHLADTLHMNTMDHIPGLEEALRDFSKPKFMGVYDTEGHFLGFKKDGEEEEDVEYDVPEGVDPLGDIAQLNDDTGSEYPDIATVDDQGSGLTVPEVVAAPPERQDRTLSGFLGVGGPDQVDGLTDRQVVASAQPARDKHLAKFLDEFEGATA